MTCRSTLKVCMKTFLLSIFIGVALEVLFFMLAVFADGACHCVKPTVVFFPYGGIALLRSWESLSLPLLILQFPAYSLILARVRGWSWRLLALLVILILHVAFAVIGLITYR